MNIFIFYNRPPPPLPTLRKNPQIISKKISNSLQKLHFIWDSLQLFWPEVTVKQYIDILHFEVIDAIHAKC